MRKIFFAAGIACLLLACTSGTSTNNNTDTTKASDTSSTATSSSDTAWISLFDGEDLKGWHTYGKSETSAAWNIDSGAIHFDASKRKADTSSGGDLVSNDEFSNFDFVCDWKISKVGNSGIIFYVNEDTTKYKETWNTGPEMQVLDNAGHPDAKIPKHRAGDLYDLISCSQETVKPWGQWNHVEIKSVNGKLDLYLNGTNVVSTTLWDDNWKKLIAGSKFKDMPDFGTFKQGHIALQDHGNEVWYKNIMIKKL